MQAMERITEEIIKTLAYFDLFDFPLKEEEIWRYLKSEKAKKKNLKTILKTMLHEKKIEKEKEYYFIAGRSSLGELREKRAEISRKKIEKAKKVLHFLKLNPYLKMVAITGTLAAENAEQEDDVDLMMIFEGKRLFIGRAIEFLILKLLGKRRNPKGKQTQDLLCPNLYLSEEALKIENEDIYTAHEIMQIKIVWDREEMGKRFLSANRWVKNFFPHVEMDKVRKEKRKKRKFFLLNLGERIMRKTQLNYMRRKISKEKISEKALFFHPEDQREKILALYGKRWRNLSES